jgi:cyclopropane-fatty-acyl-phospholipid synthase
MSLRGDAVTGTADYQGASPTAIQHHYDVGNEFYAMWLDPTLTYSCALWEGDDDTLQAAQERKSDYLAREAGAIGVGAVLDVGCGWGGLLRRLVEQHDVANVVGLTLSEAQAGYVSGWADNRYDVRVENWADHQPSARYDAIISIGAFEHFAHFGMRRPDRVAAYRRFFESCHEWLPYGGRLALQTNIKGNNVCMDRRTALDMLFIIRHIFPQSVLPWPSEILEASERLFDVVFARNDPDHYARTCQAWLDRLLVSRERASVLVGERIVMDYERYLSAAVDAFTKRHLGLLRVVFERV